MELDSELLRQQDPPAAASSPAPSDQVRAVLSCYPCYQRLFVVISMIGATITGGVSLSLRFSLSLAEWERGGCYWLTQHRSPPSLQLHLRSVSSTLPAGTWLVFKIVIVYKLKVRLPRGMTAIEEMARIDVLCTEKTGSLTSNRLKVDCNLVEVVDRDMDKDTVALLAARASRLENQDAIDNAITNMLANPKEAPAHITEVYFQPFNPVDKRTAITYIDSNGNWYGASKGAPEQILNLAEEKEQIAAKVYAIIDKYCQG